MLNSWPFYRQFIHTTVFNHQQDLSRWAAPAYRLRFWPLSSARERLPADIHWPWAENSSFELDIVRTTLRLRSLWAWHAHVPRGQTLEVCCPWWRLSPNPSSGMSKPFVMPGTCCLLAWPCLRLSLDIKSIMHSTSQSNKSCLWLTDDPSPYSTDAPTQPPRNIVEFLTIL